MKFKGRSSLYVACAGECGRTLKQKDDLNLEFECAQCHYQVRLQTEEAPTQWYYLETGRDNLFPFCITCQTSMSLFNLLPKEGRFQKHVDPSESYFRSVLLQFKCTGEHIVAAYPRSATAEGYSECLAIYRKRFAELCAQEGRVIMDVSPEVNKWFGKSRKINKQRIEYDFATVANSEFELVKKLLDHLLKTGICDHLEISDRKAIISINPEYSEYVKELLKR